MKHFKVLVILAAICTVGLLYQCKTEPAEIVEKTPPSNSRLALLDETLPGTNDLLDKYLSSPEYKEFLAAYNFEPSVYYRLETNNKEEFFGIQIKHLNSVSNLKDFYLIIYPKGNSYKTLVFEQELGGEIAKMAIYDTEGYTYLAGGDLPLSPNGPGTTVDRTCASESSNFNDCFVCGWNNLASDWVSIAACAAVPAACLAAVVIHCSPHIK